MGNAFTDMMSDKELIATMTDYEKEHPFFRTFPIEMMDATQSELLLGYMHTWQFLLFKTIVEYAADFGADTAIARLDESGIADATATYNTVVSEYGYMPHHSSLYDCFVHFVATQRAMKLDAHTKRMFMLTVSSSVDLLIPTCAKMGVKDLIVIKIDSDNNAVVMSLCLICRDEYVEFPNTMDDECRAVVLPHLKNENRKE